MRVLYDVGGPSIASLSFDSGFYALSFETDEGIG